MWKDYLYLSKRERAAFWIFTILIVVMQLLIWTRNRWIPLITGNAIEKIETVPPTSKDSSTIEKQETYKSFKHKTNSIKTTYFDPNTTDSATLVSLGIKSYVAKNIIKYRNKGGVFKKPEDFSRIYGLDEETFSRLKPYIKLKEEKNITVDVKKTDTITKKENDQQANITPSVPENAQIISLEINTVDTNSLQLLKGVGKVTSQKIVRYASQLGGMYDISQLSEIKGIYPATLETLKKALTVDKTKIRKLNINKASLEKLKSHPYINFYQARVIVELRKSRGSIKALNELLEFKEFSENDINRLIWYLDF